MPTAKSWKELGLSANNSPDRPGSNAKEAVPTPKQDVTLVTKSDIPDAFTLPMIQTGRRSSANTKVNSVVQLPEITSRTQSRKPSISLEDRRPSISLHDGRRASTRKSSFATFGRRVSNIVGMRKLLTRPVEIKEDNPMEKIRELPKEPRFSATLSDEAQFATLKGYEDVLHGHLEINYPDYKNLLNRNKTPGFPVKRKKSASIGHLAVAAHHAKTSDDLSSEKGAGSIGYPDVDDDLDDDDDIWLVEMKQNPRRHSTAVSNKASPSTENIPPAGGMKKARSMPFVAKNKGRLVMTYRLESAMDILDSIRKTLGQASISPRLKTRNKITPLRDYNVWSTVWSREFVPSS